jgi:hypothetical protein
MKYKREVVFIYLTTNLICAITLYVSLFCPDDALIERNLSSFILINDSPNFIKLLFIFSLCVCLIT